jgi:beta-lactamase class A
MTLNRFLTPLCNGLCALLLVLTFTSASSIVLAASKGEKARVEIEKILSDSGYKGGIALRNSKTGDEIDIHGDEMFPMASVFKLPIAIAILKKIDNGALKHNQKFHLGKEDMVTGLRGPIAKKFPQGDVDLTTDELLKFMVSDSDNTACDFLIKVAGGPEAITSLLRKMDIKNINVSRSEKEIMATTNEPGPKYLDASSPMAMVQLYDKLRLETLLSHESTGHLLRLMTESNNPPHIVKGLPSKTNVAHKSGWCGQDLCVNDTALITLPKDQGSLIMAIFLYGNKVDFDKGSSVISKIAKVGFEALAVESR